MAKDENRGAGSKRLSRGGLDVQNSDVLREPRLVNRLRLLHQPLQSGNDARHAQERGGIAKRIIASPQCLFRAL